MMTQKGYPPYDCTLSPPQQLWQVGQALISSRYEQYPGTLEQETQRIFEVGLLLEI